MKRVIAASIAIAALIQGSAMAADMSVFKNKPAKEPPFVVYNWSGLYIGVQGGVGWVRRTRPISPGSAAAPIRTPAG